MLQWHFQSENAPMRLYSPRWSGACWTHLVIGCFRSCSRGTGGSWRGRTGSGCFRGCSHNTAGRRVSSWSCCSRHAKRAGNSWSVDWQKIDVPPPELYLQPLAKRVYWMVSRWTRPTVLNYASGGLIVVERTVTCFLRLDSLQFFIFLWR